MWALVLTVGDFKYLYLMLDTLESSSGGGETREDKVARMCKEMQSKAPAPYDIFEVKERLKLMGALSSLNIFLKQEIDRMQRVS